MTRGRILRMARGLGLAAAGLIWVFSAATAEVNIATTTSDVAAIARAIGGSLVKADSLTSGAGDPHYVAAKPSIIRRVKDADLLIAIGAELEEGWLPAVIPAAANPRINPGARGYLELAGYVSILQDTPGTVSMAQGHVHKSGNPHFMLDPRNGLTAARVIAQRLAELDSGNAATYRANLAAFERAFQRKWTEWQGGFAPYRGKSVIAYHKSLPYLARAFGFYVVGEVEPLPGISPTVSHLESLIDVIRRNEVRLLLMEGFYERRSAQFLGGRTGIKTAVIPHNVEFESGMTTYFDLFDGILKAIKQGGAS